MSSQNLQKLDPRRWRSSEQHQVGHGRLIQQRQIPQRLGKIGGATAPLRKPTAWKSDDYFALADELPNLNALGHTRLKTCLHGYSQQWYKKHELDAGFCVAPQWYKNEEDYARFPLRPHQQGVTMCGNDFFPIPQAPRRFLESEDASVRELQNTAFVRYFHVPTDEVREYLKATYWPRAKRAKTDDKDSNWYQRIAASFVGGKLSPGQSIWLPKGEMWNDESRIQGPAEAVELWDGVVNKGLRSSSSIGGFSSRPPTYANSELRTRYETGDK